MQNTMTGKEGSKMIINSLSENNEMQPEELAQTIKEVFPELVPKLPKSVVDYKGLYYSLMKEIYARCRVGKQSFDEWIANNNLEIA